MLPDQLCKQQTASLQVDVVQLQEHHHHGPCMLLIVDYHGVGTERDECISQALLLLPDSLWLVYDYVPFGKDKFFHDFLAICASEI